MSAPFPDNEADRLKALHQYEILDTAPELEFDDIVLLESHICNTPIALITLVDETRQWFKAKVGLAVQETSRDAAFCGHAILKPDMLIVPDALSDERFATNPLVVSDPHIRFYAGMPLMTPGGYGLGTLCVIDRVPRELAPEQMAALQALTRQVIAQLELRRLSTLLSETNKAQEQLIKELQAASGRIKTLEGIIPICANCKMIRDDEGFWQQVEAYFTKHSEAAFSHGICPDCLKTLYPEYYK